MRDRSKHGRRRFSAVAGVAVIGALALTALVAGPAGANHRTPEEGAGPPHASVHRVVNVKLNNLPLLSEPILEICTGDGVNGDDCMDNGLPVSLTRPIANYGLIVDVQAKTAESPRVTQTAASTSGAAIGVEALGTGIESGYVGVRNNRTGAMLVERTIGPVLGSRVHLNVDLSTDPNG